MKATRFNFVSKDGDGFGLAYRIEAEGYDVRLYIDEEKAQSVGDGLIQKASSINDMLAGADQESDIFIFDTSGDGLTADYLRSLGFAVLGGSAIADRLERDREFGLAVMSDCGIDVPKTIEFDSFDAAKRYVDRQKDKRLVYKPSNVLGDKSPSHISYNADDLIKFLDMVESEVEMESPQFVLQEFHKGIAVSSELWFDGTSFLPLFNHTLERKELMNDNIGPSGGCTGNIVWSCPGGECPLCDELRKMEKWLRKEAYHGMLDLNAIVAEDGIFGLEWTPRFGYDAGPTLCYELLNDFPLGAFLHAVATKSTGALLGPGAGRTGGSGILRDGTYAAGIRVSVPPWPSEAHSAKAGLPIFGIRDSSLEHLYPFNVKKGELTLLETAGVWGILFCSTGRGASVKSALRKPYEAVEGLQIADKQFRTDLVGQFEEDLKELEALLLGVGDGVHA